MKSGTCPKCGSTDVRVCRQASVRGILQLGIFAFNNPRIDEFICPDCGYVESFIADLERHREKIRAKCRRVKD